MICSFNDQSALRLPLQRCGGEIHRILRHLLPGARLRDGEQRGTDSRAGSPSSGSSTRWWSPARANCEAVINSLHEEVGPLPSYIDSPESWGVIKLAVLPSVLDASLSRRAVMLILACLRTCGTLKVLTEVPRKERYVIDLYTKLGSYPAQLHHCQSG